MNKEILKATFFANDSLSKMRPIRPQLTRASWYLVLMFALIALFISPNGPARQFYSHHPYILLFNISLAIVMFFACRFLILVILLKQYYGRLPSAL